MTVFDQIRLLQLKKYLLYSLLILKGVKFTNKKRKKDMLDSENQKQSLTDAFE